MPIRDKETIMCSLHHQYLCVCDKGDMSPPRMENRKWGGKHSPARNGTLARLHQGHVLAICLRHHAAHWHQPQPDYEQKVMITAHTHRPIDFPFASEYANVPHENITWSRLPHLLVVLHSLKDFEHPWASDISPTYLWIWPWFCPTYLWIWPWSCAWCRMDKKKKE